MLYFAYGSNMSSKRLLSRTPTADQLCTARLERHDLRFHKRSHDGSGKCDAFFTDHPDDFIIGVVYRIADHEKPVLDNYEGLGRGYEKKVVQVTTLADKQLEVFTYYADDLDDSLQPYNWYLHHVLSGAIENALPDNYIDRLRQVTAMHDPVQERHDIEMKIYQNINVKA